MNGLPARERLTEVQTRIKEAQARSEYAADHVNIIAVTKYVTTEQATQIVQAGCQHIGENRWPDAREKVERLQDLAKFHFVGHIQSRKARHVIKHFGHIHSLDRMSLAKELDKRAEMEGMTIPCFVQLNVSGEQSKFGRSPDELAEFLSELNELNRIEVIGLMTMAPYEDEPEKTRPVFRALRRLRDRANAESMYKAPLTELSMGMSNDFEIAVEEGATWVRLGSVLVGTNEEQA